MGLGGCVGGWRDACGLLVALCEVESCIEGSLADEEVGQFGFMFEGAVRLGAIVFQGLGQCGELALGVGAGLVQVADYVFQALDGSDGI